jgi:hypothetical protein
MALSNADPLPSWNEGPAKQAILDFVVRVTTAGGPDFVPVNERIAVFDNEEPENSDYPKDPEFRKKFGPRGVLHTCANADGTQKIEDSAAGAFKKLGLKPEMVTKAVPVLTDYVSKTGGADVGKLLAGALK